MSCAFWTTKNGGYKNEALNMRYTADDEEQLGGSRGAEASENPLKTTTWDGAFKKPKWDKLPDLTAVFSWIFLLTVVSCILDLHDI